MGWESWGDSFSWSPKGRFFSRDLERPLSFLLDLASFSSTYTLVKKEDLLMCPRLIVIHPFHPKETHETVRPKFRTSSMKIIYLPLLHMIRGYIILNNELTILKKKKVNSSKPFFWSFFDSLQSGRCFSLFYEVNFVGVGRRILIVFRKLKMTSNFLHQTDKIFHPT